MKRPRTAIVVGGGIGGMTAALMLAREGLEVTLLEQAPEFGEIGAGVQLSPNATRVLFALGLEEALNAVAFTPESLEVRSWRSGEMLSTGPLGEKLRDVFGYPYYHLHRADLIRVLESAVRSAAGIQIATGAHVTRASQTAEAACAEVEGGASHTADLLVGADGIRSSVRESLFGPEQPRFTGTIVWRGMVPADSRLRGLVHPVAGLWLGPGAHFVHYYVRSGQLVNFVACLDQEGWEVESWTERGEMSELRADFRGWHETVQALIDRADPEQCYKWALFDRDPLRSWTQGRITLLGDACHPTLPFMAQGACMAVEDGAVLARAITKCEDLGQALARYEELRLPRTAGIQLGSRRNHGIYHMRRPRSWLRDYRARRGQPIAPASEAIFSYDALSAVND